MNCKGLSEYCEQRKKILIVSKQSNKLWGWKANYCLVSSDFWQSNVPIHFLLTNKKEFKEKKLFPSPISAKCVRQNIILLILLPSVYVTRLEKKPKEFSAKSFTVHVVQYLKVCIYTSRSRKKNKTVTTYIFQIFFWCCWCPVCFICVVWSYRWSFRINRFFIKSKKCLHNMPLKN